LRHRLPILFLLAGILRLLPRWLRVLRLEWVIALRSVRRPD
jgi:hypothetical protein